jgi:hypothetical protein
MITQAKPSGRERRKFPRIPMGVSIYIPHLHERALCHDLSKEGCFFQELDLGQVGETLSVVIDLPDFGLIPIEAEVAHKGETGKSTGLHFAEMDPADTEKLSFFVDLFQE